MKTRKIGFSLMVAGAAAALAFTCGSVLADNWQPSKVVTIIVGTAPGGSLDVTARQIQKILQEDHMVKPAVTVLNKPGAGSAIAWTFLNEHAGDGNYVSISAPNVITNKVVGSNPLNYKDITPLATLFSEYIAFSVRPDSPLKTGKDLIEKLRKDPTSLTFGIASARGATNHMAAGTVLSAAGIDLKKVKFVVFKSSAQSGIAMMGGHVDVDVATVSNAARHLPDKQLRILGITAPHRLGGIMADVPTWKEQGIDAEFAGWRGVIGPKGMTKDKVAFWDKTFAALAKTAAWNKALASRFWISTYKNSTETESYLDSQNKQLHAVLSALGLAKN
jgi:putative tricarboxylic transport membrane protein